MKLSRTSETAKSISKTKRTFFSNYFDKNGGKSFCFTGNRAGVITVTECGPQQETFTHLGGKHDAIRAFNPRCRAMILVLFYHSRLSN